MAKKYVATIMNRLYLGDEKFLYYVSHPTVGEYDQKNGIFKDRNNMEYLSITEPCLFMSEITNAFSNIVEMDTLPQKMNEESMHDAISSYNYYCSRHVYYVSKTDNNEIFCIPIDLDGIRDRLNHTMETIHEHGGLEQFVQDTLKQEEADSSMYVEDDEVEEIKGNFMHNQEVKDDIATILLDMFDGLYSIEDLREIKEVALEHRDSVEGLLDSLNLQIAATENGEASIHLRKKETKESLPNEILDNPPKKVINRIDLVDLFNKVTKTLIAQDIPTQRVITELARKEQNPSSKNRGLLITGPTGVGKTKMMQLIAKYLDRPFFKVDSTQLTIPGYVGKNIEEVLWDLYIECGRDVEKAEKAIIFFDEIDKKGSSKKDDVAGRGVLNVLLPFIEGASYDATPDVKTRKESVKIDTTNMISLLGGAFTDVYQDLKETNSVGFGAKINSKDAVREATVDDFIKKAKMPDEFMGRVSIIKLNDLDAKAIRRIILESDESAVKVQKRLFDELGVKLTIGDSYIDEIVNLAVKRKTGARGLNSVVEDSTWVAYGDAYTHDGEIDEIILTGDTVKNPKNYQKVLKKDKK